MVLILLGASESTKIPTVNSLFCQVTPQQGSFVFFMILILLFYFHLNFKTWYEMHIGRDIKAEAGLPQVVSHFSLWSVLISSKLIAGAFLCPLGDLSPAVLLTIQQYSFTTLSKWVCRHMHSLCPLWILFYISL